MQEITIPESLVKQEFYKSTEKSHIIACWIAVILNMIWFLSDYFIIREYWLPFFIFRLSVSVVGLVSLLWRQKLGIDIYICMFIVVLGISIENAYMSSVMDIIHFQKQAFAYMVLFIGVGMLVLWEIKLSWFLFGVTLVSNSVFYTLNSPLTIDEFITNGALLIFTVAIFCVFLIRARYRLTMKEIKSRLELEKSKGIIEQKHIEVVHQKKEITDSINYAKKIQYSILPSKEEIHPFFPNHFIFFQPKDIVSGDFYWLHHQDDLSFFAVADCTGHGVPGAFMTMIAHSILIEVVIEQKLISPDVILSGLHHTIFKTLQQKKGDEYSQDGLDISFCVIDHKKNLLHFSGAYNSAFLTDGKEIKILKATSKSIGGLSLLGEIESERTFKLETVELKKDTLLVLTTDGILDQLNEQDEKFGTNRFKHMLLEMHTQEPEKNLHYIEATFNNWKKSTKQLDDVLLAGIKF